MTVELSEASIGIRPHADEVIVRAADEQDIAAIVAIVAEHARQGHLLPRSAENIRSTLASWLVAEVDGVVTGIGSLLVMTPVLVEVRSLAVLPAYRTLGVGAALVRGLVVAAQKRGFPTIFALTRAVRFFEKLGFVVTSNERFPEKVWRDCVLCPLRDRCDETAVVLELQNVARANY